MTAALFVIGIDPGITGGLACVGSVLERGFV